ncbi:MAG TPA: hypothetical protein VL549_13605 [Gemmatimonadales bacterium]|nr:hypothetical protein [Gemmatimonadales bacterium]
MRRLALVGLACVACIRPVSAQVAGNVEAGVSNVKYDRFLASGAASLGSVLRWDDPAGRGFVNARGTYLRFESGRHSVDASANGSWFTPIGSRWRGELGLAAGASQYANIASFRHADLEARIHWMQGTRGSWLGATVGSASFGSGARSVAVLVLGRWWLVGDMTMFASADRSFIGDTAYSDLRSSARWRLAKVTLEGVLGTRVWSRGGGRGVFIEGSAALALGTHAALVVSGGRYPTDAVSGSIAGRYATAALRLGSVGLRRPNPSPRVPSISLHSGNGATVDPPEDARLDIETAEDDAVRLIVHAIRATTVEISGDFTDWQPVTLTRVSADDSAWEGVFRISRGLHRINVRRDGGAWRAPVGTTRSADDYDGEVGVFLVP